MTIKCKNKCGQQHAKQQRRKPTATSANKRGDSERRRRNRRIPGPTLPELKAHPDQPRGEESVPQRLLQVLVFHTRHRLQVNGSRSRTRKDRHIPERALLLGRGRVVVQLPKRRLDNDQTRLLTSPQTTAHSGSWREHQEVSHTVAF